MGRALSALLAALGSLLVFATASPAQQDLGSGTDIGGSVSSTLSLDLTQTGATVRAVVTATEPDASLSVAPADGRSGLSATVSGPYAPLDPLLGLTLVAWDDVLAGKATTLRLKSAAPSTSASTVLITLSAATP
jgi:hypothetical protein